MTMGSQRLSNQQEAGQPFWLKAAEPFGSPVYVYDEGKLASDYLSLRDALPKDVTLYYSMKVNPNPRYAVSSTAGVRRSKSHRLGNMRLPALTG